MRALNHTLTWQAPRPLWRGTTPFAAAPQILRFASDDFMEQILSILAEEPARISDRIATPETWRDPPRPSDGQDPIVRVPLPAPFTEAKRSRMLRAPVAVPPPVLAESKVLKLYQPAHQRYYLVAGTLACAIPGLPERAVAGGHETVHFVLRRLMDVTEGGTTIAAEFAYVKEGDDARWQRVAASTAVDDAAVLAAGEELLPLFPLQARDESGIARTLWAGLVPVARREEYLAKQVSKTVVPLAEGQRASLRPVPPTAKPNSRYARTTQIRMEVVEPWKAMLRGAAKAAIEVAKSGKDGLAAEPADKRAKRVFDYNIQFQMQSWLLLLDLRKWIAANLPDVEKAIVSGTAPPLGTPSRNVWDVLDQSVATTLASAMDDPVTGTELKTMSTSLRTALRDILQFETALETATVQYTAATALNVTERAKWPGFHFPLAGITSGFEVDGPFARIIDPPPAAPATGPALDPPDATGDALSTIVSPSDKPTGSLVDAEQLDRFAALLSRALIADQEPNAPPLPHAVKLRDVMLKTAGDQGRFVLRMVHVNADCGPLHPPTLSARSVDFRLASFFDPDAPVRPITITLPSDTSPAGLRKHGRGAAFVMSDMLCGQVQRAKGLGFTDLVLQVLPWPFHKDIDVGDGGGCKGGTNLEIGMICSLSIPIITLCALILLMIMVTLFDFIFRWLPWFIACFPIPKLKGKTT